MVKDYELRAAIEKVAQELYDYDPNPITWLTWVIHLLKQLDSQSKNIDSANQQRFEDMIAILKDAIYNRQKTGGW
ncbi:MAG: hypothetical protein IT316_13630 [Anaerolineales bacterium]|nr:hypothetical protein [Anaerolineales bacterium]